MHARVCVFMCAQVSIHIYTTVWKIRLSSDEVISLIMNLFYPYFLWIVLQIKTIALDNLYKITIKDFRGKFLLSTYFLLNSGRYFITLNILRGDVLRFSYFKSRKTEEGAIRGSMLLITIRH